MALASLSIFLISLSCGDGVASLDVLATSSSGHLGATVAASTPSEAFRSSSTYSSTPMTERPARASEPNPPSLSLCSAPSRARPPPLQGRDHVPFSVVASLFCRDLDREHENDLTSIIFDHRTILMTLGHRGPSQPGPGGEPQALELAIRQQLDRSTSTLSRAVPVVFRTSPHASSLSEELDVAIAVTLSDIPLSCFLTSL